MARIQGGSLPPLLRRIYTTHDPEWELDFRTTIFGLTAAARAKVTGSASPPRPEILARQPREGGFAVHESRRSLVSSSAPCWFRAAFRASACFASTSGTQVRAQLVISARINASRMSHLNRVEAP